MNNWQANKKFPTYYLAKEDGYRETKNIHQPYFHHYLPKLMKYITLEHFFLFKKKKDLPFVLIFLKSVYIYIHLRVYINTAKGMKYYTN